MSLVLSRVWLRLVKRMFPSLTELITPGRPFFGNRDSFPEPIPLREHCVAWYGGTELPCGLCMGTSLSAVEKYAALRPLIEVISPRFSMALQCHLKEFKTFGKHSASFNYGCTNSAGLRKLPRRSLPSHYQSRAEVKLRRYAVEAVDDSGLFEPSEYLYTGTFS